jgi:hypothetical protein
VAEPTTHPIEIQMPAESERHLSFAVGACVFKLARGEHAAWVEGTYTDPTGSIPPNVDVSGGDARISQRAAFDRIPRLREPPVFDLRLGTSAPYRLTIEGGAMDVRCDLGGLPLTRFEARLGAGQIRFAFDAPNTEPMELLKVSAGAADLDLRGLANANAAELAVDGGAAAFHLDFGGTLARDARALVNTGVAGVDVTVPANLAARIVAKTTLGAVNASDAYTRQEREYLTPAAVAGKTPLLTIEATVTLGQLELRTS